MSNSTVIVVGGGVVGLVTALGLAQAGVDVTVYEARADVDGGTADMVYHWPVLPGLDRLGLVGEMESAGLLQQMWTYKVFRTGERILFDLSVLQDEVEHPHNIHLGVRDMSDILTAHLRRHPNARVESGVRIHAVSQDEHGVSVTCDGPTGPYTDRASWLVGADGAGSTVRRSLGLSLSGLTWPERLVSTTIRFDLGTLGFSGADYQVDPQFGAVISSIDRDGAWRYGYVEDRTLREETIPERMKRVFAAVLPAGSDPQVAEWSAYRMHERVAERFRVGRVLLVGDAAHITNPTSAHGMTGGLFDAFALIEALTSVVNGSDAGLLDRYADSRRGVFLEHTSPMSCDAKEFVFSIQDEHALESTLQQYRYVAAHPDRLRRYLRLAEQLQSPSLLTGRRIDSAFRTQ